MANLNRKLCESSTDGLFTGLTPPYQMRSRTIRKGSSETTYVRGTIMAVSSADNKLVILGSTAVESEILTPDCVLADDVTVGTTDDVKVAAYTAGCFDPDRCTVAPDHEITAAEYDALRIRDIVFVKAH